MTRLELAGFTRALMPYMSSANAVNAARIARGLEMTGSPDDVTEIVSMVAPHMHDPESSPAGLLAILEAMVAL